MVINKNAFLHFFFTLTLFLCFSITGMDQSNEMDEIVTILNTPTIQPFKCRVLNFIDGGGGKSCRSLSQDENQWIEAAINLKTKYEQNQKEQTIIETIQSIKPGDNVLNLQQYISFDRKYEQLFATLAQVNKNFGVHNTPKIEQLNETIRRLGMINGTQQNIFAINWTTQADTRFISTLYNDIESLFFRPDGDKENRKKYTNDIKEILKKKLSALVPLSKKQISLFDKIAQSTPDTCATVDHLTKSLNRLNELYHNSKLPKDETQKPLKIITPITEVYLNIAKTQIAPNLIILDAPNLSLFQKSSFYFLEKAEKNNLFSAEQKNSYSTWKKNNRWIVFLYKLQTFFSGLIFWNK